MSDVRYLDIPSCPGYRAGDDGSIWSRKYGKWRKLKPGKVSKWGHLSVNIFQGEGKKKSRLVHRLVLEAFVGPCPDGMECCHNDGDPVNNRLENLRWDTSKANKADTRRHGKYRPSTAKITMDQAREIRAKYSSGGTSHRLLGLEYGISADAVYQILKGANWKEPVTA